MPKDPIRIIGTKVKEIYVKTITEITITIATTMLTGIGIMIGIGPRIEMVSECKENFSRMRGATPIFCLEIMM